MALIPIIMAVFLFPYAQFGLEPKLFTVGAVRISIISIICLILYLISEVFDFMCERVLQSGNMQTTFGTFIGPVTDKIMIAAMFLLFTSKGLISPVPVIFMIGREIVVDGCQLIAHGNGKMIAEGSLGTVKKVSQMITIALLFLNNLPFELWELPVTEVMLWFSAFVSIVGGISCYNMMKEDIYESK